jgi:hypothetical protein
MSNNLALFEAAATGSNAAVAVIGVLAVNDSRRHTADFRYVPKQSLKVQF